MILEAILRKYEEDPVLVKRRQPGRGNPTASQAGTCAAQLQMLRFPAWTHPEMRSVRSAWVFEDGDLHAAALKAKIEAAYPNRSALAEELFYFPVPITPEQERTLEGKIANRTLWGTIAPGFVPPLIQLATADRKARMRLAERDPRDGSRPRPMGFIVDPGTGMGWAPVYIDLVWSHPEQKRLMVVENKSMSRFAFRRALLGTMGYRERCQLAMIAEATGLDTMWFVKAKDTAHLCEIGFVSDVDRTTVTIRRSNGTKESYWVKDSERGIAESQATGQTVELRESEDWDIAEVWTPRDPTLLKQIRDRILTVLLFDPPEDPEARLRSWAREYGPNFNCQNCGGTGVQTLKKGGDREPLKTPKECEDCGGTVGTKKAPGTPGSGKLDRARLSAFPCGYCSVIRACWPMATLEVGDKPVWWVTREDVEAKGLTFRTPEAAAVLPVLEA
jgi:hypothetical protein